MHFRPQNHDLLRVQTGAESNRLRSAFFLPTQIIRT